MNQVSHRELDLSFWQIMRLRKIRIFGLNENCIFKERYKVLAQNALIQHANHGNKYVLTERAKMYLRYRRRDRIRFLIPVIISIFALLGGYDVYQNKHLLAFLQTIMRISKTIMENLDVVF